MKKIIIPVIIAAALGVGGGVAAVTLRGAGDSANAAIEVSNDILKSGTYYLDGDVNAEVWVEVTPDYITLKGTDIDKALTEAIIRDFGEFDIPVTDEKLELQLNENKRLYCTEQLYQLQYLGLEDIPYVIKVDRDNLITDREELLNTNAGFRFNDKTNTISLAVGEFTLVE